MITPKPRKLPSGNYNVRLRLGGDSISITEATERACIQQAQLIKSQFLAGQRFERASSARTLGQAVDAYIASKSRVLSPSTLRVYGKIRKLYFQQAMAKPISSIKNWQKVVNDEAGSIAPKTLKNAWSLIATVVEAETGTRPRVKLAQIPPREHAYLTPEQIPLFCDAVRGDPVEIPALLALSSLRLSELLGLTWAQVDLSAAVVRVSGAVVLGEDENGKSALVRKSTNKNASSVRTVPIMPQLVDALRAASAHAPADPVVTLSPKGIYSRVNTICRRAGLPEVGVHGLRHSFASLAYSLGLPYKVTMQIGGWSDDATMQRIYTHIAQSAVTEGAAALTAFYSKNANENANA